MWRIEDLEKILNKVLKLVNERKVPAKVYKGMLIYTNNEIVKYYKVILDDGNPATRHDKISKEDFLNWLYSQSKDVQDEVYKNLLNYIKHGKPTAPSSEYLFGY